MAVKRGEVKADQASAASPLIKEAAARALSKAQFECKCRGYVSRHFPCAHTHTLFVRRGDGHEDRVDAQAT